MNLRVLALLLLLPLLPSCSPTSPSSSSSSPAARLVGVEWSNIESAIAAQRQAGYPDYDPTWLFVVDPAAQRMHIIDRKSGQVKETFRCGTGKGGLGIEDSQTPPGFFTMGGVRIAKNGNTAIQTGDSKKGVSGIYAEMLYPPSHPDPTLRGMVPNGVVIHSYNPEASEMLRQRRAQRLIGRVPCTTGCPVPDIEDAPKLIPYLIQGAGKFDPTANPNANLQSLIRGGQVTEYQRNRLGAAVYVLNRQ
ncbi:L,D-transpeptidase [Roseibacillus persicicus]|uniref:L,D-transpeptidase n=1 Tax=Roseibacillus persicicus TaxID=454148 RepID=UPI001674F338|nr:L,D-transpeptidase [Roseibacillus persicicus]